MVHGTCKNIGRDLRFCRPQDFALFRSQGDCVLSDREATVQQAVTPANLHRVAFVAVRWHPVLVQLAA